MKQVFYAIDMGAPSGKYSGFYCWRYDPESKMLDAFEKSDGWYKCIDQIVKDSYNHEVYLTIEAALWGMKDKKSGDWVRRFNLKRESDWSERPWYTGAGASTGLMAQIFLHQISTSKPKKKSIVVRESYISGLSFEGCSLAVSKPTEALVRFKTKHACDAFEGLLLSLEAEEKNFQNMEITFNNQIINLSRWVDLPTHKYHEIVMRNQEKFALGILHESDIFDFKLGEILFTRRDFGILPRKKNILSKYSELN